MKVVTLDDLAADDPSEALQLLRDVFIAPEEFRPRIEPAQITEKVSTDLDFAETLSRTLGVVRTADGAWEENVAERTMTSRRAIDSGSGVLRTLLTPPASMLQYVARGCVR